MKSAMEELMQMVTVRSVVHRKDPSKPSTQYLVLQGFIEPISLGLNSTDSTKDYKLTQRGVDEANRYAEGQKAIIEGENDV